MRNLNNIRNFLWVWVGDYNEIFFIIKNEEAILVGLRICRNFILLFFCCAPTNVGFSSYKFTWFNGLKGNANTQERLDSYFISQDLKLIFPKFKMRHLTRPGFNHAPILIHGSQISSKRHNRSRPLRFKAM